MSQLKLLHATEDERGFIYVFDDGECRYLSFAAGDEQSCCLKAAPHILQYEYTQAMLLSLLFCQPKRVLVMGLGGGSLVNALFHYKPDLHITVIELREAVITLAQQFFYVPRSKRIHMIHANADSALSDSNLRKVDLIFADLYHAEGIDQVQLKQDFIARCAQQLKTGGCLALNCWDEHEQDPHLQAALSEHFADIRVIPTTSNNWVIVAIKQANWQSNRELKEAAIRLEPALGFSLLRSLNRARAWN
jgi:spermidine synthase